MDSQVLFFKNENGTLDRVLGLNSSTILTTTKNLSQLSDVDTTGVSAQKLLKYDGTKWIAELPSFAGLSDVEIDTNTLSSSNLIKWNPLTQKWINRDLQYAVLNISGRIKDSVINIQNVEFNILDPNNYELDDSGNTTFSITSFTNSGVVVDTTTDFQVENFINGGNYRIEWNFNYSLTSSPLGQVILNFIVKNQVNGVVGSNFQSINNTRVFANSASYVNNSTTASRFFVSKSNLTSPLLVGATPLNVNMTISIIEL
jgi:hypothetical protein